MTTRDLLLVCKRWEVWCADKRGELYEPECDWLEKTSEVGALRRLWDAGDEAQVVICVFPGAAATDVSPDLARQMVRRLIEAGHDFDEAPLPRFISLHLTNDEIDEEVGL